MNKVEFEIETNDTVYKGGWHYAVILNNKHVGNLKEMCDRQGRYGWIFSSCVFDSFETSKFYASSAKAEVKRHIHKGN